MTTGEYPVYLRGERAGTVRISKERIRYIDDAFCPHAHGLVRLSLYGGRKEGYPVSDGVEAMLTHLGARLAGAEFPHEVGLFLGYPAADVEGFRRNAGRNCKLCGHWKVYGQVEEARRRFLAFDRCREALCRWVAEGRSLEQLFPAV